jgi:hypothetical protein
VFAGDPIVDVSATACRPTSESGQGACQCRSDHVGLPVVPRLQENLAHLRLDCVDAHPNGFGVVRNCASIHKGGHQSRFRWRQPEHLSKYIFRRSSNGIRVDKQYHRGRNGAVSVLREPLINVPAAT